jgi:hypothetical protein
VGSAFGGLGTLIPFVVAYIAVLKIDPFGILFTFGCAMVFCGFYYRTPFPVQPGMRAKIGISIENSAGKIDRRISVAPMMDWTDAARFV